MQDIKNNINNT